MSQYLETNKIEIIADPGTSLGAAVETKEVKLDNYQSTKILISTTEGTEAKTIARVVAVLPDATEHEIKNTEITIGANTESEINIVANEIAHYDATSIKIKIDAVDGSTVTCGVVALLGEPRYAIEKEDEIVETTENEVVADETEPVDEGETNEE